MKTVQMDNETRKIISGFVEVMREYNAQNVYKKDLTDEETISENEMKNRYISYVNDIITNKQSKDWAKLLRPYDDYTSAYYDVYDCLYNGLYNEFYEYGWQGEEYKIRYKYKDIVNADYSNPKFSEINDCYDELAQIICNRASRKATTDKESEEAEIEN